MLSNEVLEYPGIDIGLFEEEVEDLALLNLKDQNVVAIVKVMREIRDVSWDYFNHENHAQN